MQFKSIFTFVAVGLSLVMADDETTTSTSTMTQTVTITQCNPTATSCPGHSTTTPYPVTNSTVSVHPSVYHNSSSIVIYTSKPTLVQTTGPSKSTTTAVATAGASGLFLQSGLLLTVLGAGMAIVA